MSSWTYWSERDEKRLFRIRELEKEIVYNIHYLNYYVSGELAVELSKDLDFRVEYLAGLKAAFTPSYYRHYSDPNF